MTRTLIRLLLVIAVAVCAPELTSRPIVLAQQPGGAPAPFYWHDDYTEYHLLAPATHQFAIVYFLTQRQPGMTYVLNQTRSGSEGSGIAVSDPRTGKPLKFDYMTGAELAAAGVQGRLNADEHYIRAHFTRPVPEGGEGRVRIEKTYKDEASYTNENGGASITFARSLGIGRNAIVLPAGYSRVSSNVAADIATLDDGRIRLSFENVNGYASDVRIRAARAASPRRGPIGAGLTTASDSTKTLYELKADGSVVFRHEFVKWTKGDRVEFPSTYASGGATAIDMDTGRALQIVLKGPQFPAEAMLDLTDGPLQSAHVRIAGTLANSGYAIEGGNLYWSRTFIEPRTTIVLPPGFELTLASAPVTMGTLQDGRAYVQIVNTKPATSTRIEVRGSKVR
jgi:hypothetical protein